jgi:hypothetical protein
MPRFLDVGLRLVAAGQVLAEELRRGVERGEQVDRVVVFVLLLRVARDFHPDALGEFVDRVEEFEAVVVDQERDRGAVRAAAEAVVELLGRRNGEARRALIVERAARREFLALALERHARGDHLDDVGAREQVVDESVGDAGHRYQDATRRTRARCGINRRRGGA